MFRSIGFIAHLLTKMSVTATMAELKVHRPTGKKILWEVELGGTPSLRLHLEYEI